MPYLAIDDFKNGLDARKSVLTAPAGSLTKLINAVVTPGGEIQKRRAFVKVATLTGTKGLAAIGTKVVAFSATAATAPTIPGLDPEKASLEYHTLPALPANAKMMDFEPYDGNLYSTWFVADGATAKAKNPHYYDDRASDTVAHNYVETEGSGKGYWARAFQSKMYVVSNKYLYFSAIKYPKLWEEAAKVPPSGATAVSVLPVVGISGERVLVVGTKKTYRWDVNTNGVGNWASITTEANDMTWLTEQDQRAGAGYINTSLQESGGKGLQGIEIYYDKLAIMSAETTQLWSMDPDPNQNALAQVLRNNGTRAAKSVAQYGSGDVLFLATSGIRSLKARDASNSVAVSDIGSPVDNLVLALGRQYGFLYLANCQTVNEPIVGRFWAVFPDKILVLSYFPGPSITAWSEFNVPFKIDYAVTAGDCIFIRSGDDLYVYGGVDGATFDDCGVEVRFPFLDGGKPGHMKMFAALDATVTGTWRAAVSYNYDQPDAEEDLGYITSPTWNKGRFAMQGYASHVSIRFYNAGDDQQATLSNAAIHYQLSDDET